MPSQIWRSCVNSDTIAWCPHESNLPASSGSAGDQFIRFWNTQTGVCLNSINTGSQVCSLLWSKREEELLSSHGPTQNQLTLWKYPSMVKIVELLGHTSRALFPTRVLKQVLLVLNLKIIEMGCIHFYWFWLVCDILLNFSEPRQLYGSICSRWWNIEDLECLRYSWGR